MLGAGGQLGRDLVPRLAAAGHEVVAAGRREIDVTRAEQVDSALAGGDFQRVVNCAAYTAVDRAESEAEAAFAVNRDGAELVARACARASIPLCHISTDFVFGQSRTEAEGPFDESEEPRPRGVYAQSKRAGEVACLASGAPCFLVRTSWLYGNSGPNFPLAIIRAAATGRELRVVSDQVGSPTWTGDLAAALVELIPGDQYGVYHISGEGSTTWLGFARLCLREVGLATSITAVSTEQWGAAAFRPRYSVLGHRAWSRIGLSPLRDWRAQLAEWVHEQRRGPIAVALAGG